MKKLLTKLWQRYMTWLWRRRFASLMAKGACGELKGNWLGWPIFTSNESSWCLSLVGPTPWDIAVDPAGWGGTSQSQVPDNSVFGSMVQDYRSCVTESDDGVKDSGSPPLPSRPSDL